MELLCAAVGYLVVSIATCGTHAASYKGRFFTYSTSAVSWNTAFTTCSLTRGQLLTVDNNVTVNALKYIRAQPSGAAISDNIWMGLYNAAPALEVPGYVWVDCTDLDDTNTMWFPGEPNFVQTDRCIVTSPEYEWKTRNCSEKHAFFCENVINVDCTFEKESKKKCGTDGVPLSETMTEDECATRCQEDVHGSDVCWAYEYIVLKSQCDLLFGSDPYICETPQDSLLVNIGRRRCFKFADITGSEVAASAQSFPSCSKTDVSSREIQTVTTVGASVDTSTSTSTTPGTTVVTSTTLETTTTTTTTTTPTTKTATTTTTTIVMTSITLKTTTTTTSTIPTTTATTTTETTTPTTTTTATTTPPTTTTVIPTTTTTTATTTPTTTTTTMSTTTTTTVIPTTTTSTSAVTNNAVTSSVTPTVTTTTSTSSSATAEVTRDNPTSIPITSTTSTTAHSSSSPGGSFSPSINTFLSRLEAALTSPGSASTPTVTSPGRYVYEVCVAVQTFTVAEREKRTDDIVSDLLLDKKNLSSYRRKKSSAEDDRPSAQNVGGGVAIMLLVTAALIIILPDCSSILMHVVHAHKKKQLVPAQQ